MASDVYADLRSGLKGFIKRVCEFGLPAADRIRAGPDEIELIQGAIVPKIGDEILDGGEIVVHPDFLTESTDGESGPMGALEVAGLGQATPPSRSAGRMSVQPVLP